MTITETLTILAIIMGPVVGVQTQKWIEGVREKRARQLSIFKTLMATRATILSPHHVEALNMIDLEFKERKYQDVSQAWKIYLDYLCSYPNGGTEAEILAWQERRIDKLCDLLIRMGNALGYDFDEVYVRKGIYSPEAHSTFENQNNQIRQQLISLLSGNSSIKMDVQSFPIDERELEEQRLLRAKIREIARGDASIAVKLVQAGDPRTEGK